MKERFPVMRTRSHLKSKHEDELKRIQPEVDSEDDIPGRPRKKHRKSSAKTAKSQRNVLMKELMETRREKNEIEMKYTKLRGKMNSGNTV